MMAGSTPDAVNGSSNGKGSSTGDSFVDAAFEALGDFAGGDEAPGKPPRKGRPEEERPDAEDADAEVEEPLAPGAEDEGDEDGEETADEDGEAHDTRGSRENPLTAKDLPADIHVQVKVDGKKETVLLKDALDSYVGQKTISQRLNKTKMLTDEAEQQIERAKHTQASVKEALRQFLSDPDQLREYFLATEEREAVFRTAAQHYAAQVRRFRENPHEELAFQRQRDIARVQAEREHFEQERRAEQEARQQKERQERMLSIWNPGWADGIKKAGFPVMDAKQHASLLQEVAIRCEQKQRAGHELTSEDVSEFVVRAAKLLELPRKGEKPPKPAPLPSLKDRAPARRGNDPWAGKSRRDKVKDPDWFLKSLRPRDYR